MRCRYGTEIVLIVMIILIAVTVPKITYKVDVHNYEDLYWEKGTVVQIDSFTVNDTESGSQKMIRVKMYNGALADELMYNPADYVGQTVYRKCWIKDGFLYHGSEITYEPCASEKDKEILKLLGKSTNATDNVRIVK